MLTQKPLTFNQISKLLMLTLGIILVVVSAFFASSFLAILGTALIFWGVILFYITPVKHVPTVLLDSSANGCTKNIERLLSELDLTSKGVYLPPKNLKNMEASVIFLPKQSGTRLPMSDGITDKLFSKQSEGVFLTPPGLGLSLLFEKELNVSFTKTDFRYLQLNFPKLLIEDLEILERIELDIKDKIVTVEVTGSVFNGICTQTNSQPRTHSQVGCLFASALACVLAKTIGKPIIIQSESLNPETKTTLIEYVIMETEPPMQVESPIKVQLS